MGLESTAYSGIDFDELPETLREIAEVAGLPAALAIAEHWGGIRLDMPATPDGTHRLAAVVGMQAAAQLAEEYQGEQLDIPRAAKALRQVIYQTIAQRYADGASAAQLAREYGCTERWIYVIVRRMGQDTGDDSQEQLL